MVDNTLLEKVMQLDVDGRRDLIRAVEGSLDYDDAPAGILAIVDARLAKKSAEPDTDAVTLDEFERRILRARRSA